MILLKIFGCILTVFACCQFGVNKTAKAKIRVEILQKICISLKNLAIDIRLGRGELFPLIIKNFSDEYIEFSENSFKIPENYIEKNHLEKLNEMIENLGKSDCDGECEKIALYQAVFSDYLAEAQKEYKTNRKIWNTLSLGGGITVVLLII